MEQSGVDRHREDGAGRPQIRARTSDESTMCARATRRGQSGDRSEQGTHFGIVGVEPHEMDLPVCLDGRDPHDRPAPIGTRDEDGGGGDPSGI